MSNYPKESLSRKYVLLIVFSVLSFTLLVMILYIMSNQETPTEYELKTICAEDGSCLYINDPKNCKYLNSVGLCLVDDYQVTERNMKNVCEDGYYLFDEPTGDYCIKDNSYWVDCNDEICYMIDVTRND